MKIIIAFLAAIIIAQILKMFIKNGFKVNTLAEFGGMPSAHVTGVSAMMTSLYLLEGFSTLFFIALIFSLIVMRDAMGVRKAVSLNSVAINKLLKKKQLKETIGHNFYEVLAGVVLGIIVGIVVMLI